ncbi:MAG: RluA family pseudouridine synthase [Cyanobacteria bacterium P01_D01_bin.115]
MGLLHSLADFGLSDRLPPNSPVTDWYEGTCSQTQVLLRLPRTEFVEAIARGLMQQLAAAPPPPEGKMYGVLLVTTPTGELAVLKAFSGLLGGSSEWAGWVPPMPGRTQVSLSERLTLLRLEALKTEILTLQQLPQRLELEELTQCYAERLQVLSSRHRQRKQARDHQRQAMTANATLSPEAAALALAELVKQSQQEGGERRRLKRDRETELQPLRAAITQADARIRTLKQERKALSQQLQAQMHAAYSLTNFAGATRSLSRLWPTGLPTGTGDCAAPKLLHYAASHQLNPLALAEFWWGADSGDKQAGQFYGPCRDRCQPIMGFLLSGLDSPPTPDRLADTVIARLYEDDALVVVNKPSGLLAVPGRTADQQDSVLSRLRCQLDRPLTAPHRLDKGTSGLLVLAKTAAAHRHLSDQFAQRQVKKVYEAILSQPIRQSQGTIDLPLWRDPSDRPKTCVEFQRGKPSLTEFRVLTPGARPRLGFVPHSGRTHQLRVHAAHPQGLNAPIVGDTLYGAKAQSERLQLHARSIKFVHPTTGQSMDFNCPVPF